MLLMSWVNELPHMWYLLCAWMELFGSYKSFHGVVSSAWQMHVLISDFLLLDSCKECLLPSQIQSQCPLLLHALPLGLFSLESLRKWPQSK